MSKDVSADDDFSFTEKFSSKFFKVKIGNGTVGVVHVELEPEKLETTQRLEEDRKLLIDVAILNFMKARRALDCNNIMAEVTNQIFDHCLENKLRFKIDGVATYINTNRILKRNPTILPQLEKKLVEFQQILENFI